jgi:Carbohydrate binding module (family 6)/PLD-like domain
MANQTKSRTQRAARLLNISVWSALLFLTLGTLPAAAQERVMLTAVDDALAALLEKIRNEDERLDIGMWLLNDGDVVQAIIDRHRALVPVRVLGDRVSIFEGDEHTRASFLKLANAGVPIRIRYEPTDFPEILHWKAGIFVGQNTVEFGSANWTTFELAPWTSTNFKDETAMFTNDAEIFQAFLTKFEDFWVNTTHFKDWSEAYQLETGQPWVGTVPMNIPSGRLEATFNTNPPGLYWSQGSELNDLMIAEINSETNEIDMVSYRLTVPNVVDALIARHNAGVSVRVFIEPTQYRNPGFPEYWLVGATTDRLWAAGIPIKQRTHEGLTHMKTLITSRSALIASSNFTQFWQRDHNYFIQATTKPTLYFSVKDRFDDMWNDASNYENFTPVRPDAPALVAPANGAVNVANAPRLEWRRAPWATSFDVYIGTSTENLTLAGRVNAVVNEFPPETYSFTPTGLQPSTRYIWRVVSRTYATDVNPAMTAGSGFFAFTTAAGGGGGTSGPFTGTPVALPGTIQAENFDLGADGVAYHDVDAGNNGNEYRTTNVDIASSSDSGGGFCVGWTAAGEWLKYTVNVTTAGNYNIEFRVASAGAGGTFHFEVNGVDKTGPISVPNTGGWQAWSTITKTNVSLSAGTQVWRVVFDSVGSTGAIGNLNHIRVVAGSGGGDPGGSMPFGGTPVALPGTIQAENFDEGAPGVAYVDTTAGNSGGQYRSTGVDIEATSDSGGGFNIGWTAAGEWLNYTVNVATAGTYTLEFRVAARAPGGTFHLEVNGTDKTGPLTIPNTGSYQTWTTISKTGVSLPAGPQVFRLVIDSAGTVVGNINYIRVVSGSSGGSGSTPFSGTPIGVPGTIEAENFDTGGAGVAYQDLDGGNNGGAYRSTDVDLASTSDSGGGFCVGWASAGEWLKYTVNVATAGTYTIQVRVASSGAGGAFHIEVNGVDKTGPLSVPSTNGWDTWTTISRAGVALAAGQQVIRVVMDTNSPSTGAVGNFNWIRIQ